VIFLNDHTCFVSFYSMISVSFFDLELVDYVVTRFSVISYFLMTPYSLLSSVLYPIKLITLISHALLLLPKFFRTYGLANSD